MTDTEYPGSDEREIVHGYAIMDETLFSNNRGFALGENPHAVQPYVTWQFTEENGKRDYYWGHYTTDKVKAQQDFNTRVAKYEQDYGVTHHPHWPVPDTYKYYSTQRPVDFATFPKTQGGPIAIENYDSRIPVERGAFEAWGALHYTSPLTEKQMDDYELRPTPGNIDLFILPPEQREHKTQVVGQWEQSRRLPDFKRLTWYYSDFGSFVKKEFVPDKELTERFDKVVTHQKGKAPIAEQLKAGADRAALDNAALSKPARDIEKDR